MALEQKWSDMYGQGDVDGIAELLAKESILLAPGHSPAVGRGDVVALTRALMDAEAADGSVIEGSYLVVWIKEYGEWKAKADIFN